MKENGKERKIKMNNEKIMIKESINYFNEIRDRLIDAENLVCELKHNPQYLKAKSCLNMAKSNGLIDEIPTRSNGYKCPEILI